LIISLSKVFVVRLIRRNSVLVAIAEGGEATTRIAVCDCGPKAKFGDTGVTHADKVASANKATNCFMLTPNLAMFRELPAGIGKSIFLH
jgi:hypothetical protein